MNFFTSVLLGLNDVARIVDEFELPTLVVEAVLEAVAEEGILYMLCM